MQLPGWASVLVLFFVGLIFVLAFVLDQIPPLSRKAIRAIKAVRAVRDELKAKPPKGLDR
ncbi:hypothetical protein [Streptomyces asiaticus]|uniref:hypothetical protein n=1 Tax=Streptomyces asiaticus TaxID=114695 RepID=UPI003F66FEBF